MHRALASLVLLAAVPALAHATPPVRLSSDRAAISGLLPGAGKHFVREVRLDAADRRTIQQKIGWTPDENVYRFYVGRDAAGTQVGAVVVMTEYTAHGLVRAAVGLAPDGKVKGVTVTEVGEETWPWVKQLVDGGYLRSFEGRDAADAKPEAGGSSMVRFYGRVIAGLVKKAGAVHEVGQVAH